MPQLIKAGIVAGIKPEELRGMIPRDQILVFEGWNEAHSPKKAGSDAPTFEQHREIVRQVDGANSRAA